MAATVMAGTALRTVMAVCLFASMGLPVSSFNLSPSMTMRQAAPSSRSAIGSSLTCSRLSLGVRSSSQLDCRRRQNVLSLRAQMQEKDSFAPLASVGRAGKAFAGNFAKAFGKLLSAPHSKAILSLMVMPLVFSAFPSASHAMQIPNIPLAGWTPTMNFHGTHLRWCQTLTAVIPLPGSFDGVFPSGFVEAISLILLSELGDKTFFVAGLFAMKTNQVCQSRRPLRALFSLPPSMV